MEKFITLTVITAAGGRSHPNVPAVIGGKIKPLNIATKKVAFLKEMGLVKLTDRGE